MSAGRQRLKGLAFGVAGGLILAAVAGCAGPEAPPAFDIETQDWQFARTEGRRILTDHYDLYTTIRDEELLELVPHFLESAYHRYTELVPPRSEDGERLVVYLFSRRADWDRFAGQHWPGRASIYRRIQSGAFAEGTTCVAYYISRPKTLSVLSHEGLHQYLAEHVHGEVPAWLNEGLACYCEGFELHRGKCTFTPRENPGRLNSLREAINGDSLLPLREILRTNAGAVIVATDRRVYSYYAQAWALIVYLRDGPRSDYTAGLERLLTDLGTEEYEVGISAYVAASEPEDGTPVNAAEAAFRKYITEDLAEFEEGFRAYLKTLAEFVDAGPATRDGIGSQCAAYGIGLLPRCAEAPVPASAGFAASVEPR